MKVSIIIPTRNRASVLAQCLQSLTRQTLSADQFEVVVVDNGSNDNTAAVAAQFESKLQLRYTTASTPGLHVGRHIGMRLACTELLMFADDDIEAVPTWAEAVLDVFSDSSVALVGGNNHPLFESSPPAWLQRWWEQPVYKGRALGYLSILDFGEGSFDIDPGFVWGCNFSIRKEVLIQVGGFHPDAFPREHLRLRGDGETHVSTMVRESGLRARFDSRASVYHRVDAGRMQREYFEQRGFAQGISDSYAAIRRSGGSLAPPSSSNTELWRRSHSLFRKYLYHFRAPDVVERELASVRDASRIAWRQGYEFHQQQVLEDPTLLAWVLRDNYWSSTETQS